MMHKQSNLFWNDAKGPFENICTFIANGAILFGKPTQKIIILLGELFGFSGPELGKKIDDILQVKTIDDVLKLSPLDAAEKVIEGLKSDTEEFFLGSTSLLDFKGLRKEASVKGAILARSLGALTTFFSVAFTWLKRIFYGGGALWVVDQIREGKKPIPDTASSPEAEQMPLSNKNLFPIIDLQEPSKHEIVDIKRDKRPDRAINKNPFNQIISDILSK